jgi:hypothetical protein
VIYQHVMDGILLRLVALLLALQAVRDTEV